MSNLPVVRAITGGAIVFAIAGTLVVSGAWPAATMAAPLSCAATPTAAQPPASPAVAPAAPIPTEAVIAAEVNPPGDIPDNQAFVTYTAKDGGYSIAMPEGWARQESGPNVTFVDKLHQFSVEVRCAGTAPTVESAQTVEAADLAQQMPAFELVDVTAVDLPAGPAHPDAIPHKLGAGRGDRQADPARRRPLRAVQGRPRGGHLPGRASRVGQCRRLQPDLPEFPMDGLAALEARDLYRFYHASEDETLALRGVSLQVAPGETVAVVGPSGSGKSTLLACLAGLDEPDGGWVAVAGDRLTRRPQPERARIRAQRIGVLLQSGNLLDHLTVRQNLLVALALAGTDGNDRVQTALEAVGLGARADAIPAHLSGGELARAGLALALINEPAILLADEPTGEVDADNERHLLELLAARARSGGAALIVTHSAAVAAAADRTLTLVDGQLDHG